MDDSTMQDYRPLIIAHRGEQDRAPENTLTAVEHAWRGGADAVEVDIHYTQDGRIMVHHDPTTLRMTGTDLTIADSPANLLRNLSVTVPGMPPEQIPFLDEIVPTIPDDGMLFIELKCGVEVFSALETVIAASGALNLVSLIGFDRDVMRAARQYFPTVPVYLLMAPGHQGLPENPDLLTGIFPALVDEGFNGVDILSTAVTPAVAEAAHAAELDLVAWTVNDVEEARRLMTLGVQGITTDRARWLRRELALPDRDSED